MLPLKKLAELAEMEQKTIFPYKILNVEIKEETVIKEEMFNNNKEFEEFKEKNGNVIKTYEILEDYCKNDALITKKSIIKY
jgi:UDP-N-acetylmuramate-alanine ligase